MPIALHKLQLLPPPPPNHNSWRHVCWLSAPGPHTKDTPVSSASEHNARYTLQSPPDPPPPPEDVAGVWRAERWEGERRCSCGGTPEGQSGAPRWQQRGRQRRALPLHSDGRFGPALSRLLDTPIGVPLRLCGVQWTGSGVLRQTAHVLRVCAAELEAPQRQGSCTKSGATDMPTHALCLVPQPPPPPPHSRRCCGRPRAEGGGP